MPSLTFWYEFASTYTYPTAMRIDELAKAERIDVTWRPFLLGPIFKNHGWSTSPFNIYPAKGDYMWRDLERICADYDLPFHRPDPFPQNGLLAARLATVGMEQGWGKVFSKAVYRAEFGAGKNIDDAELLSDLVQEAGGNADDALKAAGTDKVKTALKQATTDAVAAKIFGSPSFVTEKGELFWGNDRLEDALRWANRPLSK